jgi:hypothetical protein
MKVLALSKKQFCNYIINRSVVCFGAGLMLKEAISTLSINEKILGIFDNSIEKQKDGFTINRIQYNIHPIGSLIKMRMKNPVLLITSKYYREIIKQLSTFDGIEWLEVVAYPELKLNIKRGTDEYFDMRVRESCIKIYREFLESKGLNNKDIQSELDGIQTYMDTSLPNGLKPFVIPRLVYIVSSVCTLRCKDCLALMPYYKQASHIPIEQVMRDIHFSLDAVDMCTGVELIGGETFCYPWLGKALHEVLNNDKVRSVILSTNGTVIPDDDVFDQLSDPKILIRISNYGIKGKIDRLIEIFERNNIAYQYITEPKWKDGGGIEYRNKSIEQIHIEFLNCENSRVSKTIAVGKLFVCPRSYRLLSLGLYESANDYVKLNDTDNKKTTQKKILEIFLKDYADACQYCDFGSLDPKEIIAGIQL